MGRILLLVSVLLAACNNDGDVDRLDKEMPMNSFTETKQKLTFTCVHETISKPLADALFQYARWLQKDNQLKHDETVDVEIVQLYRIATENTHYKANINLQNGTMRRGHLMLRGDESLRRNQNLIDAKKTRAALLSRIRLPIKL